MDILYIKYNISIICEQYYARHHYNTISLFFQYFLLKLIPYFYLTLFSKFLYNIYTCFYILLSVQIITFITPANSTEQIKAYKTNSYLLKYIVLYFFLNKESEYDNIYTQQTIPAMIEIKLNIIYWIRFIFPI